MAIWQYYAQQASEATADRVIANIYEECDKLGDMPGMGHMREDLLDDRYKFWSVYSYVIVYRWQVSPIQIVAIVHGARELSSFFTGRLPE